VALDTPQNLKNQLRLGEKVIVLYRGPVDIQDLEKVPGVMNLRSMPGRAEIVIDRKADSLDRIIKMFAKAHIQDISIKEPDLEDVFIELAR
jgi:ABC-type uncharacterized transport system ATPase subunit